MTQTAKQRAETVSERGKSNSNQVATQREVLLKEKETWWWGLTLWWEETESWTKTRETRSDEEGGGKAVGERE